MNTDPAFRMTVQDVFSIKGRGTVVTGQIEGGSITAGDEIRIQGQGSNKTTLVAGVEVSRRVVTQAGVGDHVGLLLKDISKRDIQPGDLLTNSDLKYSWQA